MQHISEPDVLNFGDEKVVNRTFFSKFSCVLYLTSPKNGTAALQQRDGYDFTNIKSTEEAEVY